LFTIPWGGLTESGIFEIKTIAVPGNVLDAAIFNGRIVASIDNFHEPGSTKTTVQNSVCQNAAIFNPY
jgi:hypothetical protein